MGARLFVLPFGDIEHEHALHLADLGRGKADARRGVHRLQHVVHQRADLVVDGGDRAGFLAKPFVWQNEDRS